MPHTSTPPACLTIPTSCRGRRLLPVLDKQPPAIFLITVMVVLLGIGDLGLAWLFLRNMSAFIVRAHAIRRQKGGALFRAARSVVSVAPGALVSAAGKKVGRSLTLRKSKSGKDLLDAAEPLDAHSSRHKAGPVAEGHESPEVPEARHSGGGVHLSATANAYRAPAYSDDASPAALHPESGRGRGGTSEEGSRLDTTDSGLGMQDSVSPKHGASRAATEPSDAKRPLHVRRPCPQLATSFGGGVGKGKGGSQAGSSSAGSPTAAGQKDSAKGAAAEAPEKSPEQGERFTILKVRGGLRGAGGGGAAMGRVRESWGKEGLARAFALLVWGTK